MLKGGKDSMDKHLSGRRYPCLVGTMHLSVEGKLALRLFHYMALNTYKLFGACRYVEILKEEQPVPNELKTHLQTQSAEDVRRGIGKLMGPFADFFAA